MPKIARELTALEIKYLPVGTHPVGGVVGLYFRKTINSAFFFLRYTSKKTKSRRDFSIGSYPQTSLKQAREIAHETKKLIEEGRDPVDERKVAKALEKAAFEAQIKPKVITFEQIAMEWVYDRARSKYWNQNPKGEKETIQILKRHAFPALGEKNIEMITPEDIRKCMEPIWQSVPSSAKKARIYINKIFQWAIALHKRKNRENPADMNGALGILMESLQKNRKPKQNFAACSVEELPRLMKEIHSGTSMSARAAEFAILTATRSRAVRLAHWQEFDLKNGIWTIPRDHDKVKTPNRDRTIFLSSYAVNLLKNLPRFSESPFVFTSNQGTHLSDDALRMFLRGLHEKRLAEDGIGWIDPVKSKLEGTPYVITIHGTARSTFRTWAKDDVLKNNRRFDQEAVELCLLRAKDGAYQGVYDRARLPKERKKIMEAWGRYCYSLIKSK